MSKKIILLLLVLMLLPAAVFAQDEEATPEVEIPSSYLMSGFTHYPQMWNNCGPATITMALSYFGYTDNQVRAANWLKPNGEDKNVSPWQMLEYVNTQVPEIPVYATQRFGGTLDTLKTLISNDFPVIIEAGYDPPRAAQGWMGHYLLVIGYDDTTQIITTHDSYEGPFKEYTYDHIQEFWQHFNYTYLILYSAEREGELMSLLGNNADETDNLLNAFELAREEAIADPDDSFAWFNMGSILVNLEMYDDAAVAFDQARSVGEGLPWRMLWYQFGPYEAYLQTGRNQDVLDLANQVLDNSSRYVEESYYYAGRAREALGETERAISNYQAVLAFNHNFEPARDRLNALQNS